MDRVVEFAVDSIMESKVLDMCLPCRPFALLELSMTVEDAGRGSLKSRHHDSNHHL